MYTAFLDKEVQEDMESNVSKLIFDWLNDCYPPVSQSAFCIAVIRLLLLLALRGAFTANSYTEECCSRHVSRADRRDTVPRRRDDE